MFLCGEVKVSGPEFDKKEFDFESKVSGEFYLHTKKGLATKIDDFDIWIEMDGDKEVSIETNAENGGGIEHYLHVGIKSKSGGAVALTVSPKQAIALSRILGNFAAAHHALQLLSQEEKVKAKGV